MPFPTYDEVSERALFDVLDRGAKFDKDEMPEGLKTIAEQFVGAAVNVTPIDNAILFPEDYPITALCYRSPAKAFSGGRGFRPQTGVLVRPHPQRARGTIQSVSPTEGTFKVTPRRWSPYRPDMGYFLVNPLDEDGEQLVNVDFLES